jgi:hypothetical protein
LDTEYRALTNLVTVNNLILGNQYVISVTAVNVIGESIPSNNLTVFAGLKPS